MQSRDFAFWLNGFFELSDAVPGGGTGGLSKEQVAMIKIHLALVFEHDTSIKQNVGTHPLMPAPLKINPLVKSYSMFEDPNATRVIC